MRARDRRGNGNQGAENGPSRRWPAAERALVVLRRAAGAADRLVMALGEGGLGAPLPYVAPEPTVRRRPAKR